MSRITAKQSLEDSQKKKPFLSLPNLARSFLSPTIDQSDQTLIRLKHSWTFRPNNIRKGKEGCTRKQFASARLQQFRKKADKDLLAVRRLSNA